MQPYKDNLYMDDNGTIYCKDGKDQYHQLPDEKIEEIDLPMGLENTSDFIKSLACYADGDVLLVKYARRKPDNTRIKKIIAKINGGAEIVPCIGTPFGCLVSFSMKDLIERYPADDIGDLIETVALENVENTVRVGWSKIYDSPMASEVDGYALLESARSLVTKSMNEAERAKTFEQMVTKQFKMLSTPKETAYFSKANSRYIAVVRALVDSIQFKNGVPCSEITGRPLPRSIAKMLPKFIERTRRYYKDKTISNVG